MKQYRVAVVGALGAVGQEMLKTLAQRRFPAGSIRALDVPENAGKHTKCGDAELAVEATSPEIFKELDIALFAVGEGVSRSLAPEAAKAGCVVIDNSSAWRLDPAVPLVVPECNAEALREHKGIVANPNCSTIIALVPLKPLNDYAGIRRIIASTYQAVSGAGAAGLVELAEQTRDVLDGKPAMPKVFQHQIAFNLIPHIDSFEENGYTHEEMKMLREGRKIMGLPELMVSCTCVRVPVYRSHSESITIETERELTPEKARELLANAPGVRLADDPANKVYPMPIDSSDGDLIWVGRIRKDISAPNSLVFWCAGDQIRKGAALNAVQIAETMIRMNLI
ncbi:MAG TPA: aspartate-semialdehyde dehydrogenase [Clostridia bacterium]|nr:aspartate-semialdehyde dehydrogenase [Clostridia bacterium]